MRVLLRVIASSLKSSFTILILFFFVQCSSSKIFYVDINGHDSAGDGSESKPWRTLEFALTKVTANEGHTIKISPGIFLEKAYLQVPEGVNIEGSGTGTTIIKPDSSLFFQSSQWVFDKFLITLSSKTETNGNQVLKDFSIDGESKQLYGGIHIRNRNNVTVQRLHIFSTYYTALWIWGTKNSRITEMKTKDSAWGSKEGCSGTIHLTACEDLEVDHLDIDEDLGYGLKAVGDGRMFRLKLHDNHISVNPEGQWKTPGGASAPNIACEFYNVELKGCEIYNNYFDNQLSIAMDKPQWTQPTGEQTIRIYNNTFDLVNRAKGQGHGLELTVHDAEVDHNYFYGGSTSIVNWDTSKDAHTMQNWKIHHNTFYNIDSFYPSGIINLFRNGFNNLHIYNNTVELTGTATINFIEVNNGGVADNVKIENNLIINSNSSYKWYPNKLMSLVNNASFKNSLVKNNFFQRLNLDSIPGVIYTDNYVGDPLIQKKGDRPTPYYLLIEGSPLIDLGTPIGEEKFSGKAPDIGAFEVE